MSKPKPKIKPIADLAKRAAVLAGPHYCDNYHQHSAHPMTFRMSAWLGGGDEQATCPGHATDDTKANFDTCVAAHR